ncbi:MAG: imidazolonepropionase [Acidobacteriota bacterium]|nr:imidazolonepropionase [Acidobacteriota bacterium]MDH3529196.1 imidazolonepropionase [Acidobacteriota bacterium]
MKTKADLIIANAREVLTCASAAGAKKGAAMLETGRIENASIAIVGDVVAGVGPASAIETQFESKKVVDASRRSVVPGFVESHTHLVYAGNRVGEFELRIKGADYLEILAAGGGILSTVEMTREASEEELYRQSGARLDKLLKNGVTTCEIKTGYGLELESELKMLRVILKLGREHIVDVLPTFLPAHAVPPEWKGREDEFTDNICNEMIPAAAAALGSESRARSSVREESPGSRVSGPETSEYAAPFFIDVFCEKGAFTLDQCKRVLLAAKECGFQIKAHVDEFTNLGCARFAIENGAVSIDHLDATSDAEIELLAGSETVGIVTPTVNFNFGSTEFAPARKMIDLGCAIAVSTDYNPGSAPCPSLQTAMAIACRYQKLLPAEAVNAVTINAAAAIGMEPSVGSIEAGKQADLLILETGDYREICYEFGWNFVATVVKGGKIV